MNTKLMFSSQTDDWSTPKDFFDELDKEFNFNLDPCASDENHKCDRYFTKDVDGLSKDWSGNVFVNPPYGREIGAWVKKSYESFCSGKCDYVVMLIPARTDTKWFHDYIYHTAEIRFVKGRLKFGNCENSAPFPSMVVIWKK
jgi:phage N-6-adenine-methyltransferase